MLESIFYVKNKFNPSEKKTCENVRLGEQLLLILFFDNFNFWKSLYLKLGLNFVVSYSSSIKKLFDPRRLIYILLIVQQRAPKVWSC